jgi:hydrogenase maturation protease
MNLRAQSQKGIKRILIACIGNIFMGDDGFGVEVAQQLLRRKAGRYPEGVEVVDFGIRGIDLAYTLLDEYDVLILVDVLSRGDEPGTLYLVEPDLSWINQETGVEAARVGLDAHSMDPLKVLAFARMLCARPVRTLLVGCEPSVLHANEDYLDMQIGLSLPVQAAVDEAVKMVDSLVEQLLASEPSCI